MKSDRRLVRKMDSLLAGAGRTLVAALADVRTTEEFHTRLLAIAGRIHGIRFRVGALRFVYGVADLNAPSAGEAKVGQRARRRYRRR